MLVKPAVVVVGIGLLSSIRKELKKRTKKKIDNRIHSFRFSCKSNRHQSIGENECDREKEEMINSSLLTYSISNQRQQYDRRIEARKKRKKNR
jgi:hypothetical protein